MYKNLLHFTLAAIFSFLSFFLFGQNHHHCATTEMWEQFIEENPQYKAPAEEDTRRLEEETQEYLSGNLRSARSQKILVPVVFHILHQNGPENISDEQIHDCMRIVNEDFSATNADLEEVIPQFISRIGNANMEFRLARIDPNGNPTNGINRYNTPLTNDPGQHQKINGWPRENYLNIWVANNIATGNTAAYAILPGNANNVPHLDGIMANHIYVGSIGTAGFSARHTITHEIGHVFNLLHPWGGSNTPGDPANCNMTDGVHDTPETIGTLGICDLNQSTCGSLDNVQNIMDYSNCDVMLTQGQIDRMRASANSNIAQRSTLTSPQNADATGITELFEVNIGAVNPTICERDTVFFRDESRYDPDTWNWRFDGAEPETAVEANPHVYYWKPGLYDARLTVSQNSEARSVIRPSFVQVSDFVGASMPYSEDFEQVEELPHEKWYAMNNEGNFGFQVTKEHGYLNSTGLELVNFDNPGLQNEFIVMGPTLDTRVFTSYDLNFRVAYARNSQAQEQDRIRIEVSTDCGATWTELFNRLAPFIESTQPVQGEFKPSAPEHWEMNTVENIGSEGIGKQTRFRFVVESAGNNNLYIDDINITGNWGTQVQLKSPFNNEQNTAANVELRWQPLDNCDEYEYEVADDPAFSSVVHTGKNDVIGLSPDNDDTKYNATGLQNNQTYYWRVRGVQSGSPLDWSEIWSFTVSATGVYAPDIVNRNEVLNVYPNPTSSVINYVFAGEVDEHFNWELRSISGQQILSGRPNVGTSEVRGEIFVEGLPAGVYLFRLNTDKQAHIKKVIIE